MDNDSNNSINTMYNSSNDTSEASATDYMLSMMPIDSSCGNWPADAGTKHTCITWSSTSSTWSLELNCAAPTYTIWGDTTPELMLKLCVSAVLFACKGINAALSCLSHWFCSINEEYLALHAWCGQYLQLLLPIVTDAEPLGIVHMITHKDPCTDQLQGAILETCFSRFHIIDTALEANDIHV